MSEEEPLTLVFIPSLVSVLLRAESDNGEPLTEDQVLRIRDGATVVALPPDAAKEVEKNRGYPDIDPEMAWERWQVARQELEQ